MLARLVGTATEQLEAGLGQAAAGSVQSALGNLPELFVALFALQKGLIGVVKAALIGSVLANSLLVLGLAFFAGGLRNGTQRFDSPRARTIATLTLLAASILSVPTFAARLALSRRSARADPEPDLRRASCSWSSSRPSGIFLKGDGVPSEPSRWSLTATIVVLAASAGGAVFVSDWFVSALEPATASLHMSQTFAGLVVVAIAWQRGGERRGRPASPCETGRTSRSP